MQLLDDNPATTDTLSFQRLVDILDAVIRNSPQPPFTVGVFGAWGSGKSSLMKMVEQRLQEQGVKTVWFNAWKYDAKEVIWNALIQTIFYTMQHDPSVSERSESEQFKHRVAETAGKLAIYAAKVATRAIPGNLIKESDVDVVAKTLAATSANDEMFDFINKFEQKFDALVREYTQGQHHLVVFIDDLDRCLPENAIAVMEALKLYLDRSTCVFVIGAESSIIEEAIRQRYPNNARLTGKDYLEKIVQLPFVLPRVEDTNALSLLDPYSANLPYADDSALRELLVAGTECNPRRIKRFINVFSVLSSMAGTLNSDERRRLAKVLLIQMRFPAFYNAVVDNPRLIETMTQILDHPRTEREDIIRTAPEHFKPLYEDPVLGAFIERTKDISCAPEDIHRWVVLTRGQAAAVAAATPVAG